MLRPLPASIMQHNRCMQTSANMLPACIGTRSQAACTFRSGRWQGSRLLLNSRQARPQRHLVLRPCAARNPLEESLSKGDNINVNLRSEAEAPWRCIHHGTEVTLSAFQPGHGTANCKFRGALPPMLPTQFRTPRMPLNAPYKLTLHLMPHTGHYASSCSASFA